MKSMLKKMQGEIITDGFDYELQVWIINGVIQDCGHNVMMHKCCNGRKFRGRILERVKTGKEN